MSASLLDRNFWSLQILLICSIYGCKGNFLDRVCKQPADVGKGCNPPKTPEGKTYYFDSVKERCASFSYLGCEGNDNRFTSSDDCIDSCQTQWFMRKNKEEEKAPPEEELRQKSDCQLKPEQGPCKALITMWYHDKETKACGVFGYGGCQGNRNKFDTRADCEDFCDVKSNSKKSLGLKSILHR